MNYLLLTLLTVFTAQVFAADAPMIREAQFKFNIIKNSQDYNHPDFTTQLSTSLCTGTAKVPVYDYRSADTHIKLPPIECRTELFGQPITLKLYGDIRIVKKALFDQAPAEIREFHIDMMGLTPDGLERRVPGSDNVGRVRGVVEKVSARVSSRPNDPILGGECWPRNDLLCRTHFEWFDVIAEFVDAP